MLHVYCKKKKKALTESILQLTFYSYPKLY